MPLIDPGTDALVRNMLMLAQQRRQHQMQQGTNLLGMAQPGQTLADLGLSPKQSKLLFGRQLDPSHIPVPETPQTVLANMQLQRLNNATPEEVDIYAASATARDLGTPQITTGAGLRSTARAATTRAATGEVAAQTEQTRVKTISELVEEGRQKILAAPQPQRALAGETALLGTTLSAVEAEDLQNRIRSEVNREALKFLANPQGHAFGVMLKGKLKIDPVAAVAAMGTGMTQLIHDAAMIQVSLASNTQERETALQTRMAEAARDLSQATGYKINPTEIMSVWQARMYGRPLSAGQRDVAQIMDASAEMGFRAAIAEATAKGDPAVQTVEQMAAVLRTVEDKNTIEQASKIFQAAAGKIYATQLHGPRPAQPGPEQREWDRLAQGLGAMSLGIIKDPNGIFGPSRLRATGAGVPTGQQQVPVGGGQTAAERAIGAPQILPPEMQNLLTPQGQSQPPQAPQLQLPDNIAPDTLAAIQDFVNMFVNLQQQPPTP